MFDVAIIGAGPSGLTAGIYATRFNLKVAIFEHDAPGGQITRTESIKNYPGFKDIKGYELATNMLNQALELNVEYIPQKVVSIEKKENEFIIKTKEFETPSQSSSKCELFLSLLVILQSSFLILSILGILLLIFNPPTTSLLFIETVDKLDSSLYNGANLL